MDTLLTFLHALFEGCVGGYITLSAIHPTRSRASPSRHIALTNTAHLTTSVTRLLEANTQGWGAYVGIALRKHPLGRWRRGGQGDLLALPALFADLDTPNAYAQLATVHLPPSCIIHSGHGWHIYWFIEPTQEWDLAERTLKGLSQWLGGDNVSLAQSLRLPESANLKPARPPTRCELLELNTHCRYTLADFSPYALALPLPSAYSAPSATGLPIASQIMTCLQQHYGGYLKPNGWLAARCPLGHQHDYPGCHFNFHLNSTYAYCFGRHKHIRLNDLCSVLGIPKG
jgi:hypothetical protein